MNLEKVHEKLISLTKKWWFYVILVILSFFLMPITSIPHDPYDISDVIVSALSAGLDHYIVLTTILRIVLIILIALLFVLKDKISRSLSSFIAINYFILGILQNIVYTTEYGLIILSSHIFLNLFTGVFWIWEVIMHKNELIAEKKAIWKYWTIPLAFFAFWWPMNDFISPDFNLIYLFNSLGMLAYCAITPIYLGIVSIYHPKLNKPTIRVTSFFGIYIGLMNFIVWIVDLSQYWWLFILHIPLFTISLYMFIISLISKNQ